MLQIGRGEDGIWVSGKFFNKQGRAICELVRNNLIPNPIHTFRVKRVSPSRLKVIDDELREVLDVEIINEQAIRILGEFYLRDGQRLILRPDMQVWGRTRHSQSVFYEFYEAAIDVY